MGQLESKKPKIVVSSGKSTYTVMGESLGNEIYNRSSLALDVQGAASLNWGSVAPMPPRPLLEGNARQDLVWWKGNSPLEFKSDPTSKAVSFILHAVAITLVLILATMSHRAVVQVDDTTVTPLNFTLYDPPPPPVMQVAKVQGGGGGGGEHKLIEPTKGHLPKIARVQTLPPQIARLEHPVLPVEPTMQIKMADNSNEPNFGVPQSQQVVLSSQGSGSGSGFDRGAGGGIGMGHGLGAGPGSGGGYGGGVMSVGGGVSAPVVIHAVDPEFTETARSANYQGTVSIQLIVDPQGNPQNVHIVRHLGMGLDDKAVQAVRQYKFRPAMYQGHPVAVQMIIDVDFHLH
jgi:periplasmic protein TonB